MKGQLPLDEPKVTAAPRITFIDDILRGAVLGDFALELGLAGAATQVGLSFVPIVGPLCGLRDAFACWRGGDRGGVILNLAVLLPVVGGFAKLAEVLRHSQRLQRGFVVSYRDLRAERARRQSA